MTAPGPRCHSAYRSRRFRWRGKVRRWLGQGAQPAPPPKVSRLRIVKPAIPPREIASAGFVLEHVTRPMRFWELLQAVRDDWGSYRRHNLFRALRWLVATGRLIRSGERNHYTYERSRG